LKKHAAAGWFAQTLATVKTDVPFDANTACERCGRFGVFVFDGEKICAECYQTSGACCAEFAGNDLTLKCETGSDRSRRDGHDGGS
jgi:hypothetical protein